MGLAFDWVYIYFCKTMSMYCCTCKIWYCFLYSDLRTEPKFIVFLTQLLALFKFCPNCKMDGPLIEIYENGSMVTVKSTCHNQACTKKDVTWHSQTLITGTWIPAGNFLLSFTIPVARTSASKVLRVFQPLGARSISLRTFFAHQCVSYVPDSLIAF